MSVMDIPQLVLNSLVSVESNYNGLKKVYSIWICPSSQLYKEDSIIEYHMEPKVIYGKKYKSRYDLLSAIMIHLNEKTLKSENKLIGMLSALLSEELSVVEKKLILERDYNIPMTSKIEKEVIEMCNLSQSIYKKGEEIGIKKEKSLELDLRRLML